MKKIVLLFVLIALLSGTTLNARTKNFSRHDFYMFGCATGMKPIDISTRHISALIFKNLSAETVYLTKTDEVLQSPATRRAKREEDKRFNKRNFTLDISGLEAGVYRIHATACYWRADMLVVLK